MAKRILLVDDSKAALRMNQMLLSRLPYEMETAQDGVEAVQKATSWKPDLILMDAVMPKMDGFMACRILRSNPHTRHIPIIIVSSTRGPEDRQAAIACGSTDYVSKPVDPTELLSKVRRHLGTPLATRAVGGE